MKRLNAFYAYITIISIFTGVLSASQASANDITLELIGGGLSVDGRLIEYDGESYLVQTEALGEIRVEAEKFLCTGTGCPKDITASITPPTEITKDVIHIAGSNTMGSAYVPALIRNYALANGARVTQVSNTAQQVVLNLTDRNGAELGTFDLKREGSSTAFPALSSGQADIGISDRPISEEELAALAEAGFPDMNRPTHEFVVGLDGIILMTSALNPVESLNTDQIAGIFSGEITDWSELGSSPGKITVYATDEKSGTFRTFSSLVLKPANKDLSPSAKRFQSNEDLARAVASDAGGIGFSSFAEIGIAKPIQIEQSCGLPSIASEFAVKSGEYPLSRNLYFYMKAPNDKGSRAFLDYALSQEGSRTLGDIGFLDNSIVTAPYESFKGHILNALDAAPEDFELPLMLELIRSLEKGERLSATMRFETGSSRLDSKSAQLLPKLVDYLRRQDLNSRKIVIAGYSDTSGLFEQNKALSLKRAQAVRDGIVLTANGEIAAANLDVRAFGELFPVACNTTNEGRDLNRRVEIWLVPDLTSSVSELNQNASQ